MHFVYIPIDNIDNKSANIQIDLIIDILLDFIFATIIN